MLSPVVARAKVSASIVADHAQNQNYASLGNALLMLAFMSTGEGWNQYMHDYTVAPPYCTDSPNFLFTDCGSPGWAFSLFISWNVLSMYIFVNSPSDAAFALLTRRSVHCRVR